MDRESTLSIHKVRQWVLSVIASMGAVGKSGQKRLSVRTDRTIRTNCEMALRTVRFVKMIYGW